MANRVGPPPPEPIKGGGPKEPTAPKGASFKDKIQEIEKVSEVDLDQPRKRPFFKPSDDEETTTEEASSSEDSTDGTSQGFGSTLPSPISPGDFSDLEEEAIPVPGSSPPPVGASSNQVIPTEEEDTSYLPTSSQFWDTYGTPDEPISPTFQETKPSSERTAKKKTEDTAKLIPKKLKMPFQEEEQLDMSREKKSTLPRPPFFNNKEAKEKKQTQASLGARKDEESPSQIQVHSWMPEKSEREKDRSKEKPGITPIGSIPEPLPLAIRQAAGDVQTASTSHLNPRISALFFQMVGSILYMAAAKPGISSTEILLNSKAFEKSIFFNTTITLEKYASAPDSFNVRLTGSPEAIKVFNDNIPNLMAAFTTAYDNKKVNFRIGRLETSFAQGGHLIRRKKEPGEKDLT